MRISLLGVEIPVDVENFITPDWHQVLSFYSQWKRSVPWRDYAMEPVVFGEVWPIQPYMLQYAKELERLKVREEDGKIRTADEWVQRYFQHFGLSHFERMVAAS